MEMREDETREIVAEVERLGRLYEHGFLDPEEGIQMLVECSEAGLTRFGAWDLLIRWRHARAQYGLDRARTV